MRSKVLIGDAYEIAPTIKGVKLVVTDPPGLEQEAIYELLNRFPKWIIIAPGQSYGPHHPAQAPLAVVKTAIEELSEPGDLVLDPFCGSGTTLIAAQELGRNSVGIESDPRMAKIAMELLK